ncbi:MAG: GntR family transcriptional regulator [Chloroflexota bacterium]
MIEPDTDSAIATWTDRPKPRDGHAPIAGLSEQIALALEEAILVGRRKSGERLVESEIAADMGTSNGPVREAFHELENLGLVASIPRRGTFVTEFTAQLAREVFSLRAVLEVSALRLAFQCLDDRAFARYDEALEQIEREPDGPASSPRLMVDWDIRFHDILFDLCGHRLLRQNWRRLRVQARVLLLVNGVLWSANASSRDERAGSMVDVHRPLVESLKARDLALAEHRFVAHLAEGERRIVRKMAPPDRDQPTLVDTLTEPSHD